MTSDDDDELNEEEDDEEDDLRRRVRVGEDTEELERPFIAVRSDGELRVEMMSKAISYNTVAGQKNETHSDLAEGDVLPLD